MVFFVCLFVCLFFGIAVFSYLVCLFVLCYFIYFTFFNIYIFGLFVSWFPFMSLICFIVSLVTLVIFSNCC